LSKFLQIFAQKVSSFRIKSAAKEHYPWACPINFLLL
jgi:hypothetical protein